MERADIKMAIDICDQWEEPQADHVSSVLMDCGNEISKLREKLRVAEDAFEQAKIELIETGTCAETLDEALAKIREVK